MIARGAVADGAYLEPLAAHWSLPLIIEVTLV